MNKAASFLVFFFFVTEAKKNETNEIIKNFISKSNKTISIINVNDDFEFDLERSIEKVLIKFKIPSENFAGCEKFVKIDKYSNVSTSIVFSQFRKTKAFKDFVDIRNELKCDYVIFSRSHFLDSVLKCLVNSLGTYLIFLTDNGKQFSHQDLTNLLNKSWTDNGALRVFVSIEDQIYSYDPFYRISEKVYGKLNLLSGFITTEGLHDFNSYSLNVEMFSVSYTKSLVKNPKTVDDFIGPDASIARFIAKNLNATSKLSLFCMILQQIHHKIFFSVSRSQRRYKIWIQESQQHVHWRFEKHPITKMRYRFYWILYKGL